MATASAPSEAVSSAVDEKQQTEPFIKTIEKPTAAAPTQVPEQRPEPAPKLAPPVPDESLESELEILDFYLLTTSFDAGSSRSESAPNVSDSSPGLWTMLGAAELSTGALPLAITVRNLSLWRRVNKGQQSKLPDL